MVSPPFPIKKEQAVLVRTNRMIATELPPAVGDRSAAGASLNAEEEGAGAEGLLRRSIRTGMTFS